MAWLRMNSEMQLKFLSQAFPANLQTGRILSPIFKSPTHFSLSVSCLHHSMSFVSIDYSLFLFFIFPHVTLPQFLSFTSSSIRSPPSFLNRIYHNSLHLHFIHSAFFFHLIDMFPFSSSLSLHHLHSPPWSHFSSAHFLFHCLSSSIHGAPCQRVTHLPLVRPWAWQLLF